MPKLETCGGTHSGGGASAGAASEAGALHFAPHIPHLPQHSLSLVTEHLFCARPGARRACIIAFDLPRSPLSTEETEAQRAAQEAAAMTVGGPQKSRVTQRHPDKEMTGMAGARGESQQRATKKEACPPRPGAHLPVDPETPTPTWMFHRATSQDHFLCQVHGAQPRNPQRPSPPAST